MNYRNKLSLGEGNAPLIRLNNLEKNSNWKGELWAKCEYQNPTGSFKDRGSVEEITAALNLTKSGVVCASTGNMAASLSAYAARAGLQCFVVVPAITPEAKLRQATACGAQLIKVDGNYDICVGKAMALAKEKNLLLCGDYKTRREGQRSIGVELARSGVRFNAFVCPVGNGTLGYAISNGFAKYDQFPKFFGVQGQGADPIFRAWKQSPSIIRIIEQPQTVASAMCVGNPLDGDLTLDRVRKTEGKMFSVSDDEIIDAQIMLAKAEGIFVEKAAAVTVAALQYLTSTDFLVLILTGSGLKEATQNL